MSDRPVVARGPFVHVEATLRAAAQFRRRLWDWRPTIVVYRPEEQLLWHDPGAGIVFADSPEHADIDVPFRGALRFLDWPHPRCDPFAVGDAIAFIEGNTAVATGRILAIEASDEVGTY